MGAYLDHLSLALDLAILIAVALTGAMVVWVSARLSRFERRSVASFARIEARLGCSPNGQPQTRHWEETPVVSIGGSS